MKKFFIKIHIAIILLFCLSFSTIFAETSSIEVLTQKYLSRIVGEISRGQQTFFNKKDSDIVVVNPEYATVSAISESIDTVSDAVHEVKKNKDISIKQIQELIKQDIDIAITEIRKEDSNMQAYELQGMIDTVRSNLFINIEKDILHISYEHLSDSKKIENIQNEIKNSLEEIRKILEENTGYIVNFKHSIEESNKIITELYKIINSQNTIIESRDGSLMFIDSDMDGVSDYDEIYLYKTNPNNSKTKEGSMTDGEKILKGINPLSDREEKIRYEDPRDDIKSFVSDAYALEKIDISNEDKKLTFTGKALPNSYITVFVYSTPIIVTVKTDIHGEWSYTLDKELENGEHQMYVASVDNSGKIIARSNPILFSKSAEAAVIGIAGSVDASITTKNFLKDNFILIIIGLFIIIVILGMMFVGNHKTIQSAIRELKDQVSSK